MTPGSLKSCQKKNALYLKFIKKILMTEIRISLLLTGTKLNQFKCKLREIVVKLSCVDITTA